MIGILVPVLGRPERKLPLIESIIESSTLVEAVTFLCSPGEWDLQMDAIGEAQKRTGMGEIAWACIPVPWNPGRGDYARKINHGFTNTWSEWTLLGADDLRFHREWDEEAMGCAKPDVGVIGTNDLGNRAVIKGLHATHPLVRRSYIETGGGGWDGPGIVYHEGYDHQSVDLELVEVAKRRGAWAFAEASHVEHLHPFWKGADGQPKAPMDATYEKGLREGRLDLRLYNERLRANPA